jgi:hypothetical protein
MYEQSKFSLKGNTVNTTERLQLVLRTSMETLRMLILVFAQSLCTAPLASVSGVLLGLIYSNP